MKKVFVFMAMLLLLFGQGAWAVYPAVVGGIRDGLALGVMLEDSIARNVAIRGGIEANTGRQPLILFFGGKFYLTNIGRKIPMSLGLAFIGYTGNKGTDGGISISFIFERLFDINPLFFEAGIDVAGSGRLQAQVGYKVF